LSSSFQKHICPKLHRTRTPDFFSSLSLSLLPTIFFGLYTTTVHATLFNTRLPFTHGALYADLCKPILPPPTRPPPPHLVASTTRSFPLFRSLSILEEDAEMDRPSFQMGTLRFRGVSAHKLLV
jgi:hypothetical protein